MIEDLSIEKRLDEFIHKCREAGLKVTPQRIEIYKEIVKSKTHPSTETIYHKIKNILPSISFDTVNRTLLTFAEMGIIEVVDCTGDARRFDPNIKKHHHFLCRQCGDIIDFFCEQFDNLDAPQEIKEWFMIDKIKVIIEGVCKKCQKNGNSSEHQFKEVHKPKW